MVKWHTDLLYPSIVLIPTLVYISKTTCSGGMVAESDDLVREVGNCRMKYASAAPF